MVCVFVWRGGSGVGGDRLKSSAGVSDQSESGSAWPPPHPPHHHPIPPQHTPTPTAPIPFLLFLGGRRLRAFSRPR